MANLQETFNAETPEYPTWIAGNKFAERAWRESLEWRIDACEASKKQTGYQQYRRHLLHRAEQMYAHV